MFFSLESYFLSLIVTLCFSAFKDQFLEGISEEDSFNEEEAADELGLFLPASDETMAENPSMPTEISPKLSEQHMGSTSGSDSQEEARESSIDVCLTAPLPLLSPKKKFQVNLCQFVPYFEPSSLVLQHWAFFT